MGARLHLQISYYHTIWVAFDYNQTPLAPPGARVLVHENPKQQATWYNNSVGEWYVGPDMKGHYQCYRC